MAPAGKQKQNMKIVQPGEGGASELHAAAMDAHLKAKDGGAPSADELTSLNKLLQWGASNSDKPGMASVKKASDSSHLDREWLDAMFPDMNAAVKSVISTLNSELDKADNDNGNNDYIVELLEALEEYMSDLNYAQNIGSLKALPPLFRAFEHTSPRVYAAALWVIGSSLQDMPDNCKLFADAGGLPHLVRALSVSVPAVKLKGIRAISAFLRAAPPDLNVVLREKGAASALVAAIGDEDVCVRARACFFAAHAATSGNAWIHGELLEKKDNCKGVRRAIIECDSEDVGGMEAVLGTVNALIEHDRSKLLDGIPTLRDDLESVGTRCESEELKTTITSCIGKL